MTKKAMPRKHGMAIRQKIIAQSALADLEDLHRAGLDTDAAGDALRGGGRAGNLQHHAERAGLHALAAEIGRASCRERV